MTPDPLAALTEPARLAALDATGLMDSPAEAEFDRITDLVRRCLGVPVALVSLVGTDRQFFKSERGLAEPWCSARETPLSHSFCQYVVADDEPLVVEDARVHPALKENGAVGDLGVVAYLGVPLRTPDGHALGSLCAIDAIPRAWSDADREAMEALAETAMHLIADRYPARPGEAVVPPAYRALADGLAHAALLLAADGLVLHANGPALDLSGLPSAAVLGHPVWDALPVYDAAERRLRDACARAAAGEAVAYPEREVEEAGHATFALRPVPDGGGQVVMEVR